MPSLQSLHYTAIDPMLSAHAEGVLADASVNAFAGVIPTQRTKHKANRYRTFPRSPFLRGDGVMSLPHQPTPLMRFEWSTDSFATETYRTASAISEDELNDSDNPTLLRMLHTEIVTQGLLVLHDLALAAKLFVTGAWTGNTEQTGVAGAPGANQFTQFDNGASSDPLLVIQQQARVIDVNGGFKPNTLIVGPDVDMALKRHPVLLNRMSVTGGTSGLRKITNEMLAALFEVENYIVPGAKKVTSAEGVAEASATFDYIYGKSMLLCYLGPRSDTAGISASAARIFAWTGAKAGVPGQTTAIPIQVIQRPEHHDEKIEGSINFDHKITGQRLGVFLKTAVA